MSFQKATKSKDNILAGVCGGIAEFLGWRKITVRILWVFFSLIGAGVLVYTVLAFVMPKSESNDDKFNIDDYREEG